MKPVRKAKGILVFLAVLGVFYIGSCSDRVCNEHPVLTSGSMKFTHISPGPIMLIKEFGLAELVFATSSQKGTLDTSDESYILNSVQRLSIPDDNVPDKTELSRRRYTGFCIAEDYLYTVHNRMVRRSRLNSDEVVSLRVPTTSTLELVASSKDTTIVSDLNGVLWAVDINTGQTRLVHDAGGWLNQLAFIGPDRLCYTASAKIGTQFVIADVEGGRFNAHDIKVHGNGFKKVNDNEVWVLQRDEITSVNTVSMETQTILKFEDNSGGRSFDVSDDRKWTIWGDGSLLFVGNVPAQQVKVFRIKQTDCYNRVTAVKLVDDKVLVGFYSGWLGVSDRKLLFDTQSTQTAVSPGGRQDAGVGP